MLSKPCCCIRFRRCLLSLLLGLLDLLGILLELTSSWVPASCLLEDLDLSLTESDGWSCVGGGPEGARGGGNISVDTAVEELELDAAESVGGTGLLDVDVAAGPVLAGLGVPDCGEVGGPCGRVLEEPCGGEEEMPLGEAGEEPNEDPCVGGICGLEVVVG